MPPSGVVTLTPGYVVRFRDRVWRVDSVSDGTFTATPLDGRDVYPRSFATSLENITDGSLPAPDPKRTTDATEQDLLLRAYRLSLVHGSAPIVGLQRSRAIPTEYQLVPLLMSLGRERVRLLIADDVGIGKTIEAGLILAELMARGRVRRTLVAVPWALTEQWRDALRDFFHLDATIIATDRMPALERRLLPGQSPWEAHELCVASIDYLKIHAHQVLQYGWDLVIIDEAHLCARPHAAPSQPARDMLRHEFARAAAERAKNLLLLTATPHSGHTDSYASLLELVDPVLVSWPAGEPRIDRKTARHHICQRRRKDIERWFEEYDQSPFPRRDQSEVVVTPAKAQRAVLDALRAYTDELDDRADAAPLNAWVAAHIQKRALSSPQALRITIERRMRRLRERQATEEEQRRREAAEAEVEITEELTGEGSDEQRSQRVDAAASTLDTAAELEYLARVSDLARKVTARQDAKLAALLELLPMRANAHAEARRVIVFTRYKDTLDYLVKQIGRSLPGFQVFEIFGEMSAGARRETLSAFARAAPAVLVATDAISEGLNLQRAAAEIVHYELPWNPNRLEQRNGRVDRFGQPESFVGVRTLVYDDQLDMAVLETCVHKAEEIRAQFGFAPPFFAGGETIRKLLRRHGRRRQLSLFDQDDGDVELFDRAQIERVQAESFFGQTDVSLGEVEEVLQRSRAVTGSPEQVATFTGRALGHYGCRLLDQGAGTFSVAGAAADLSDVLPDGLVAFDSAATGGDPEVTVIDLAHPLLRRLVDDVLQRALAPDAPGRVTGRRTAAASEPTGVVHVLARFVAHAEPPVVLEEITALACPVWGDGAPEPDALALAAAAPAPAAGLLAGDVVEAATDLLARDDLSQRIDERLEALRADLAARHASLDGGWAAGLEAVAVASRDVVALTILFAAA